jgi:uncharacterized protein YuzE
MTAMQFNYDEVSDTLYIAFTSGEPATGIELNDYLLLRINKRERRAIGLTIFEYSILTQPTELGPRSFPLTGLQQLSPSLRELVLAILQQPPVSELLAVSAYTPATITEPTPITAVKPLKFAVA